MIRLIFCLGILVFVSAPVMAADDFGPRFSGSASNGLEDPSPESLAYSLSLAPVGMDSDMDDAAAAMQDIMPAAGDEEIMDEPASDAAMDGASE